MGNDDKRKEAGGSIAASSQAAMLEAADTVADGEEGCWQRCSLATWARHAPRRVHRCHAARLPRLALLGRVACPPGIPPPLKEGPGAIAVGPLLRAPPSDQADHITFAREGELLNCLGWAGCFEQT